MKTKRHYHVICIEELFSHEQLDGGSQNNLRPLHLIAAWFVPFTGGMEGMGNTARGAFVHFIRYWVAVNLYEVAEEIPRDLYGPNCYRTTHCQVTYDAVYVEQTLRGAVWDMGLKASDVRLKSLSQVLAQGQMRYFQDRYTHLYSYHGQNNEKESVT